MVQYQYTYDALGQLTREDNRAKGYTYVYTYDNAGNIIAKKHYSFTTGALDSLIFTRSYGYDDSSWCDLLTSYWEDNITYDAIGNPISAGAEEFTWEGRQLKTYFDGFYGTTTYYYNADGIMTAQETYDTEFNEIKRTEYTLNGSQIVKETYYYSGCDYDEGYDGTATEVYTIVYIYDENGSPIGAKYRRPSYGEGVYDCFFFEKNLQGDIVAVYSSSGEKLAGFAYDAWGNCTRTYSNGQFYVMGFGYRGYYTDYTTGMYYLSRGSIIPSGVGF